MRDDGLNAEVGWSRKRWASTPTTDSVLEGWPVMLANGFPFVKRTLLERRFAERHAAIAIVVQQEYGVSPVSGSGRTTKVSAEVLVAFEYRRHALVLCGLWAGRRPPSGRWASRGRRPRGRRRHRDPACRCALDVVQLIPCRRGCTQSKMPPWPCRRWSYGDAAVGRATSTKTGVVGGTGPRRRARWRAFHAASRPATNSCGGVGGRVGRGIGGPGGLDGHGTGRLGSGRGSIRRLDGDKLELDRSSVMPENPLTNQLRPQGAETIR